MNDAVGLLILSLTVGLGLILFAVAVLRWIFLAPIVKELRVLQGQMNVQNEKLDHIYTAVEHSSRYTQAIFNSVNMIRDGKSVEREVVPREDESAG